MKDQMIRDLTAWVRGLEVIEYGGSGLGVVAHACNLSILGGRGGQIT